MALCYDVLCQSSVTIAKKLVLEELLVVELVVDELLIDELLLVLLLLVLVELVVVPWLFNRRLQACIRFCQICLFHSPSMITLIVHVEMYVFPSGLILLPFIQFIHSSVVDSCNL